MKKENNKPSLSVIGSTGSIGIQTLDVADRIGADVLMLSAGSNDRLLEEQCRKYQPMIAAMADEKAAERLKLALADTDIKVYSGEEGVTDASYEINADSAVIAVSGMAAAMPMMAAAKSCRRICMANKEAIVAAGSHLLSAIKEGGADLIPVDSEHSAIFQCLSGGRKADVKKILLTASGGPFFGRSKEELAGITPERALAHPTWLMGKKITVDSATLMNKGFEVIEAMHLFNVKAENIEVVIHRESIVHSMVEYCDGAIIAELGLPDMRTAIGYAITYPERRPSGVGSVDFAKLGQLTFGKPDTDAFPLLAFAQKTASFGGTAPAVMSAADEIAVGAFLSGRIGFSEIYDVVSSVTEKLGRAGDTTLDEIFAADAEARRYTADLINSRA